MITGKKGMLDNYELLYSLIIQCCYDRTPPLLAVPTIGTARRGGGVLTSESCLFWLARPCQCVASAPRGWVWEGLLYLHIISVHKANRIPYKCALLGMHSVNKHNHVHDPYFYHYTC